MERVFILISLIQDSITFDIFPHLMLFLCIRKLNELEENRFAYLEVVKGIFQLIIPTDDDNNGPGDNRTRGRERERERGRENT